MSIEIVKEQILKARAKNWVKVLKLLIEDQILEEKQ